MANSYTQLYIQSVFAVKYRNSLLRDHFKKELYAYMGGILKELGHYPLAINGVSDHVHLFFILKPVQSVSDVMRIVKTNSSKWINANNFLRTRFNWQRGYGAFSYDQSAIKNVIKYIENQEKHHQKESFKEEYIRFLETFEIEYEEEYLFDWIL